MVCSLADQIGDHGLAPSEAHARLHARFPTLDDKRAAYATAVIEKLLNWDFAAEQFAKAKG